MRTPPLAGRPRWPWSAWERAALVAVTVAIAVALALGTARAATTSTAWLAAEMAVDPDWPYSAAHVERRLDANAARGAVVAAVVIVAAVVVGWRNARPRRWWATAIVLGAAAGWLASSLVWFAYLSNSDFPTHYLH